MKYQPIYPLSTINSHTNPFLVENGELLDSKNFISYKVGSLKKSGDYTIKGAQITASQPIIGAKDFYRIGGTHEHFVVIDGASNAEIYKYSSGWSTQSQSLTKNYKVRFDYSPDLDTLFAVNYADATRSYNGTSWSTSTNVTSAPKAKFVIVWGFRVWVLNIDVGGTAYPGRAVRSSLVDAGSITWDATNDYLQVDDVITGVGKNQDNMFIGCRNRIYLLTQNYERVPIANIGVTSHESIVDYLGWTFFASDDGFYAFNGADPVKISIPIQEYWDAMSQSQKESIHAAIKGDSIYVYFGNITVDGESLNNTYFRYNINQNTWNRLEAGVDLTMFHTFVTSSGIAVFAGDTNGRVYEMFTGGDQNGAEIYTEITTPWLYGSGAKYVDNFRELSAHGEKLSGLKVLYQIDEGDNSWNPAGELNTSNDLVTLPRTAKGNRIRFKLMEASSDNMYDLYRLDLGYDAAFVKEEDSD